MMKKHIVEQMHLASGKKVDEKTLEACNRAERETKKTEHEIQIFFHKADDQRVQDIIRKSECQIESFTKNIKTHINKQEQTLEERIQTRKLRS